MGHSFTGCGSVNRWQPHGLPPSRLSGGEFFAGQLVPCGDGFGHARADCAGGDGRDDFLRGDDAALVEQCAFDPADCRQAFRAGEGLFDVEPALVPADQAGGEGEGGEER